MTDNLQDWDQQPTGLEYHFEYLVYHQGTWYAVDDWGNFYRSSDLQIWDDIHPAPGLKARGIFHYEDTLLLETDAESSSNEKRLWLSRNGIDWMDRGTVDADLIDGVVLFNGNAVAIGRDGISTNNEISCSPWPGTMGPKWSGLAWIEDSRAPFVWSWALNSWVYCPPFAIDPDNLFLYSYADGWFWTTSAWPQWIWMVDTSQWRYLQ